MYRGGTHSVGNRFSDGLRTGNRQREKNPNDRDLARPLNGREFEIKGEKLKTVTFIWMQGAGCQDAVGSGI